MSKNTSTCDRMLQYLADDPAGSRYTLREVFGTFNHLPLIEGTAARAVLAETPETTPKPTAEELARKMREALTDCVKSMEIVHEDQLHQSERNAFTNALIGGRNALTKARS